jgi:hypothetical protein
MLIKNFTCDVCGATMESLVDSSDVHIQLMDNGTPYATFGYCVCKDCANALSGFSEEELQHKFKLFLLDLVDE